MYELVTSYMLYYEVFQTPRYYSLVDKCIRILCKQVGTLDTERFIHLMTSNHFDYSEWQREHKVLVVAPRRGART